MIITSPNLISGNVYDKKSLLKIFQNNHATLFIIDEVAIAPLLNWKKYSLMSHASPNSNFIIFYSFSKLHGLSGLRAGFATGNQGFLEKMHRIGPTFPLTGLTNYFLKCLLDKEKELDLIRKKIQVHKREAEGILQRIPGLQIKKSITNCIFCKKDNISLYDLFLKNGIFTLDLKNQEGTKKKGYVRITVHSSEKLHAKLINRLKKIVHNF